MSFDTPQTIEIDVCDFEFSQNDYTKLETLDVIECGTPYSEFFEKYMVKNIPCLIKNISDSWSCTKNWILDGTQINYNYFEETMGDLQVPVSDCAKITFDCQQKEDYKLSSYIKYLSQSNKNNIWYLKDWHLKKTRPDYIFYEVPLFFASDWLNEYSIDNCEDDFMFVYIGPEKSWTPIHADVYSSYSWSVNIIGKKKWILWPPGEEHKMKDALGNLQLLCDEQTLLNTKHFEVIQENGDALFVPSGWHHQVLNMSETISINHNWINGCNVQFVWKALNESLRSVENEISDLRESLEFPEQCQIILNSLFGMDFEKFAMFLLHIGKKRLTEQENHCLKFSKFILGKNHILFDLKQINNVIINMVHHQYFNQQSTKQLKNNLIDLTTSISQMLT